jgi:hypothetical protein
MSRYGYRTGDDQFVWGLIAAFTAEEANPLRRQEEYNGNAIPDNVWEAIRGTAWVCGLFCTYDKPRFVEMMTQLDALLKRENLSEKQEQACVRMCNALMRSALGYRRRY